MTTNPTTTTDTTATTTTATAKLEGRDLGHAIDQILPSVGRDSTMPHLMCILIESKDGSIRLVATDSHRMPVRDVVSSSRAAAFRAVVAADTLQDWGATLSGQGEVTVACNGRTLTVRGDSVALSAAVVPVNFVATNRFWFRRLTRRVRRSSWRDASCSQHSTVSTAPEPCC